jgi:hypothetical protein
LDFLSGSSDGQSVPALDLLESSKELVSARGGSHPVLDGSPGRSLLEDSDRVVVAAYTIVRIVVGRWDLGVGQDADAGLLHGSGNGDLAGALLEAGGEVCLGARDDGSRMARLDRVQAWKITARGGWSALALAALEVGWAGALVRHGRAAALRGPATVATTTTSGLDAALDVVGRAWAGAADVLAAAAGAGGGGDADTWSASGASARPIELGAWGQGADLEQEQGNCKDGLEKLHLESRKDQLRRKELKECWGVVVSQGEAIPTTFIRSLYEVLRKLNN